MTENEIKPTIEQTIYCLKAGSERYPEVCEECQLYGEVGCDHCYDDTNDMAIKCLKQLGQYRAIGTVEELKSMKENGSFTGVELAQLAAMQMRLKEYSAIGTIEEFKNLKKKSVAKKPKYQKIQYGKHKWKRKENGEIDDFAWDYAYCNGVVCEVCGETQCVHCNPKYDKLKDCEVEDYFCPTCNETVGYFYSHCKHCWQKLDWQ